MARCFERYQPTTISCASIELRMTKSSDGGSAESPAEQAHGEVERAPPRVHRRGAAAVRRAVVGEDELGAGLRRRGRPPPWWGRRSRARCPRRAERSMRPPAASGRWRTFAGVRPTAPSRSRVTSSAGAVRESAARAPSGRPQFSTSASCACRSSAATNAPDPSGAGSGRVLPAARGQPQRAACWSCGSGGARGDSRACPAPACGRAGCRTSHATRRTAAQATQPCP